MCSVVNVKFNTKKPALDKAIFIIFYAACKLYSKLPVDYTSHFFHQEWENEISLLSPWACSIATSTISTFSLGLSGGMKRPFNTPIVDSHLNMKIIRVNFCRGKTGHTMQHSYTDLGKVASCNLG